MADTINVVGLKDVSRALRKVDADAPKGLRLAANEAAGLLISKTVPKIPRRSGAAAKSLTAKSTRTAARISVGGPRAPYYPWLDFGGRTGIGRSVERKFYTDGRYVYPTLAENRNAIAGVLEAGLRRVVEDAGLEMR